jgi:molybdopterin-guanine dinucleotide biosynthesis protein
VPEQPLVATLYGGPGTGKSTTCAAVFAALKQKGYNVEIAHEYAKDLTWEGRTTALGFQPYVAVKQMYREHRLYGQVDAIITDTSTLLSLIHGKNNTPAFEAWIVDEYKRKRTLNIFIERDPSRPYNVRGRSQTATEATKLDRRIRHMLESNGVPYLPIRMNKDTDSHTDFIIRMVEAGLVGRI